MNKNINYVSLDVIANKIYKNPLLKDVNFEDIIDYSLSVIKLLRVPGVYVEESCYRDILNHKVLLPKHALNIKSVNLCDGKNLFSMRASTDTLKNHVDKTNIRSNPRTYSINNRILKTSCSSGTILIIFDTIKVDENDIPMIPNSEALIKAIEANIKVQIYSVLADLQKVSERSLNRAEQEYTWYVGKAQSEFQGFTNEDEMESFLNGHKRYFISDSSQDFKQRYSGESDNENLRII